MPDQWQQPLWPAPPRGAAHARVRQDATDCGAVQRDAMLACQALRKLGLVQAGVARSRQIHDPGANAVGDRVAGGAPSVAVAQRFEPTGAIGAYQTT